MSCWPPTRPGLPRQAPPQVDGASQTQLDAPAGEFDDVIARALATEGGHLAIGRGGYTIWFAHGCRQSGYDCETIKAAAMAAGLPVIDSRTVDFDAVARLAI